MQRITDKKHLWLNALLSAYTLLLIWPVLFKLEFQIPHRPRGWNLIPFYTESAVSLLWDAALNVCAFIPMGLYMKMKLTSTLKIILGGAAVSLAFELTQFAFAMGITDVTDLITNTLGTAAGAGIYWLLGRIFKDTAKLDRTLLIATTALTVPVLVYFWMMLFFHLFMFGLTALFVSS